MYIGKYYIWSVRNQQATSDRNSEFLIANPNETVTLQEK